MCLFSGYTQTLECKQGILISLVDTCLIIYLQIKYTCTCKNVRMYEQDRKVIGCKAAYKVKPPKTNPQELKKRKLLVCYQPLIPSQGKAETKNT